MLMPVLEALTAREFVDLEKRIRKLPDGSLIFVEALLSKRQRDKLSANSRIMVVSAREEHSKKVLFHCICLSEDFDLAVQISKDLIANRGGSHISDEPHFRAR